MAEAEAGARAAGEAGPRPALLAAPLLAYLVLGSVWAWPERYFISSDSVAYMDVARLWADRPGMEAVVGYWGPLLSWAIAPAYLFLGDLLLAAKLTVFLLGAAWVVAVQCLLARSAGAPRAALFTLVAVVPGTLFAGVPFSVMPDALLALVVVGITASMLLYARSGRALHAAATGALCGIGYLAKSSSWALFVPPCLLAVGWLSVRSRNGGIRRAILHGGALVLGFLVVAGAWIALVSLRTGRFTTGTASETRLRNWLCIRGIDAPALRFTVPYAGERWLLHNPWAYEPVAPVAFRWDLLTGNLGARLAEAGRYFLFFPAALLGLAALLLRGRRLLRSRSRLLLLLLGGFPLLFMVALNVETRYLLFVTPPLVLAACRAPFPRVGRLPRFSRRAVAAALGAVGLAGIALKVPEEHYGEAMARAAATVRAEKRGGERVWGNVMAARVPFAFLANCPMAVHDPEHEETEPEADLLLLRFEPGAAEPSRSGFETRLRWMDEAGARWVLLRKAR